MVYTLGTVTGKGIKSVNYTYTDDGVTLIVTLTDNTTTQFTIPKGDKGDTGDTGVSITGVELVSRTGLNDLYVVQFSDGTTNNFTVTNGRDAIIDNKMDIESTNALENRIITNELIDIHTELDTKYNEMNILQLLHDYAHVSDEKASRITIESSKDILSYANGDTATITATVYDSNNNPFPNQKVVFYKDDIVLDTGVTDGNGEATYEYQSQGVGDIVFGASIGSLFIETYSIEDCSYYNPDSITSTISTDITLPSSDYIISWKTARQGSSIAYLALTVDSANTVVGLGSFDGKNGIYPNSVTTTPIPSTETEITLKYENGTYTYSWGNVVLTTSTLGIASKIVEIGARDSGYVKELKIKPL